MRQPCPCGRVDAAAARMPAGRRCGRRQGIGAGRIRGAGPAPRWLLASGTGAGRLGRDQVGGRGHGQAGPALPAGPDPWAHPAAPALPPFGNAGPDRVVAARPLGPGAGHDGLTGRRGPRLPCAPRAVTLRPGRIRGRGGPAGMPGRPRMNEPASAAAALVGPGKGVLAADESLGAISARLAAAGVAPTAANRRAYREMLVTTPGLATGISGVILDEEAFRQQLCDGRSFPAALADLGLMTGIRADAGARPLARTRGETITEGLDGLLPRLRGYAGLGARFALWRAVLRIGPGSPSPLAIRANAHALGRFTSACQDAGLVALAEPAVLADGSCSLGRREAVTSMILLVVMNGLDDYDVDFGGVVLRLTMVPPGGAPATPAEVAEATISALNGLPTALAGIAFSSGGQH